MFRFGTWGACLAILAMAIPSSAAVLSSGFPVLENNPLQGPSSGPAFGYAVALDPQTLNVWTAGAGFNSQTQSQSGAVLVQDAAGRLQNALAINLGINGGTCDVGGINYCLSGSSSVVRALALDSPNRELWAAGTQYDQAGNATTTAFIVDHTPPESAILSPQNYSVMPATAIPGFVISGTAFDPVSGGVASGIDHVNLYIQVPGGWWNGSTTVGSPVAVTAQGTNNWSYVMTMGVPASPLFRRKPESDRAQARKCRFQIPKENGQTSTRNVFYQFFT